ncbi:unnamed protein product [Urochloa humidicola]
MARGLGGGAGQDRAQGLDPSTGISVAGSRRRRGDLGGGGAGISVAARLSTRVVGRRRAHPASVAYCLARSRPRKRSTSADGGARRAGPGGVLPVVVSVSPARREWGRRGCRQWCAPCRTGRLPAVMMEEGMGWIRWR